ncbi:MAG: hypothetical protein IT535_00530 [Bauldia sp.]|nr:hypothetical protein [Bauldia sp.]
MTKRSATARAETAEHGASLHEIRLELARGPGHPLGRADIGYRLIAPLDREGRLDPELWRAEREACRVVRFREGEADDVGHLVRWPGGSWRLHYDVTGEEADEMGFRFGDERFLVGEYISIREEVGLRTYRVMSVEPV